MQEPQELIILQWNCRSLSANLAEFKLRLYLQKPHVACLVFARHGYQHLVSHHLSITRVITAIDQDHKLGVALPYLSAVMYRIPPYPSPPTQAATLNTLPSPSNLVPLPIWQCVLFITLIYLSPLLNSCIISINFAVLASW